MHVPDIQFCIHSVEYMSVLISFYAHTVSIAAQRAPLRDQLVVLG